MHDSQQKDPRVVDPIRPGTNVDADWYCHEERGKAYA